jgi:hypothetical protein
VYRHVRDSARAGLNEQVALMSPIGPIGQRGCQAPIGPARSHPQTTLLAPRTSFRRVRQTVGF